MTDADKPVCAQKAPYRVDMEPGTYYWCACGRSKNQPFCDGSHEGTKFSPVEFVVEEEKRVAWCGCKRSKKGAICDGAHNRLD